MSDDALGDADLISEQDEAQGARSATTETYQNDRRGCEHRATPRFASAAIKSASPLIRPVEIIQHSASRQLELRYADGREVRFSHEFLRVFSPSAEVRGHAPGQEILQTGKKDVSLIRIEPVGHYALRLVFSDGHDSGLYSWAYLAELSAHQETLWQDYLARLQATGNSREAPPPNPA